MIISSSTSIRFVAEIGHAMGKIPIQLLLLAPWVFALELPADFPICKRSDPNLNECIKSAYEPSLAFLVKGVPELKLEKVFPIKVESMTVGEGGEKVRFVQHYNNVEFVNMENSYVESVDATVTDNEFLIFINLHVENLTMLADYNFNGAILFLPMDGNGKCTVSSLNMAVGLKLYGEFFEKKGERYVKIETLNTTLKPGKLIVNFENLFNGDPKLGAEMNHIMNSQWEHLFDDVKSGYEEALGQSFKNIINSIFTKVPYNSLFPL